jgi:hypothetical protein
MTFDTFELLKVGNRLKRAGKIRSYPIIKIDKRSLMDNRRVVYVCLNPIAVEMGREQPQEFGIYSAANLEHTSHYLNWERIS